MDQTRVENTDCVWKIIFLLLLDCSMLFDSRHKL